MFIYNANPSLKNQRYYLYEIFKQKYKILIVKPVINENTHCFWLKLSFSAEETQQKQKQVDEIQIEGQGAQDAHFVNVIFIKISVLGANSFQFLNIISCKTSEY